MGEAEARKVALAGLTRRRTRLRDQRRLSLECWNLYSLNLVPALTTSDPLAYSSWYHNSYRIQQWLSKAGVTIHTASSNG